MKKVKFFLITLLVIILNIVSVNALEIFERNENNNYGVNKKWIITEANLDNILRTKYVDSNEKIYDFANILNEDEVIALKEKVNNFIVKTNMELVILTVNEEYYDDYLNEEIAVDFYDYNDFGINLDNYSGILLLRNAYENDPYYDMYTFGEAQLYFNQARYDEVLDDIYYDIRNKYYLDGISLFIDKITDIYERGIPETFQNAYIDDMGYIRYEYHYQFPLKLGLIISLIVAIITICIMVKKNKMVKKALDADIYLNEKTVNYRRKDSRLVSSHVTHYTRTESTGGGSSGGFSSSGSSGGGHSSGGGRHG